MLNTKGNVVVALVCVGWALCGWSHEVPPKLRVEGRDIVRPDGQRVLMRGINFGGWLMMETWIPSIAHEWHDYLPRLARESGLGEQMEAALKSVGEFDDDTEPILEYVRRLHKALEAQAPAEQYASYIEKFEKFPPVYAVHDMDLLLRKRFGDFGAGRIWNAYHDTWITETDFQLARAMGFNFVRVPFWYRWFEYDDAPYAYHTYGFDYLDKAVAWAKRHGLYLMLDFHGAVGGQSPWDHTGELSRAEFFKTPEFQRRTAALWKAVAVRYAQEPTVFAYDLLNEPFSAKDPANWSEAHDLIYRAIREVDGRTIIVMEDGYKLEEEPYMNEGFFPVPQSMGWENVVYSFHFYSGADPELGPTEEVAAHRKRLDEVLRVGRMEQNRCNVPIYLGEFSSMDDKPSDIAGMREFLEAFNQEGWHWSPWTWKYVDDDQEGTIWGVYQFGEVWPGTPDLHVISQEELLQFIARLHTRNFVPKAPYAQILRQCLNPPEGQP